MKTLDRYLLKEMIVPFLIGTLSVVLMFMANELIAEFKNLSLQHVPIVAIMQLILYKTPSFLVLTLPVGTSLAASLTFTRLTRESELTAMRSAGYSVIRTVMPIAAFGLLIGGLNFYIAEGVTPRAEKQFRSLGTKVGVLAMVPSFASNVMIRVKNYTMSIGSVSKQPDDSILLTSILMVERPRAGETTLLSAEYGTYRDGVFTLRKAMLRNLKGDDLIVATPSKEVIINEKIVLNDLFLPPSAEEETASELKKEIANVKKLGGDTRQLESAYHVRFSVPASCVIFALVAPIFAVFFARSGGFMGVLLSIILVFLYYNVFVISTQILGQGVLPPVVGAWLPNVMFGILGFIGYRRLE